jgi:hypothetical protein
VVAITQCGAKDTRVERNARFNARTAACTYFVYIHVDVEECAVSAARWRLWLASGVCTASWALRLPRGRGAQRAKWGSGFGDAR